MYRFLMLMFCISNMLTAKSQTFIPNYDEEKVPDYQLPDIFTFENGEKVKTTADWQERRAELLDLFAEHVYGHAPEWDGEIDITLLYENKKALNGTTHMRELKITLLKNNQTLDVFLLLYLPLSNAGAPIFMGYNFFGNHTTTSDTSVQLNPHWIRNNEDFHITENRSTEASRGVRSDRWPVKEIIQRGYGLATIYCGDLDPDYDDGFQNGVHQLMQTNIKENTWGTIAAWSWGLSRLLDAMENNILEKEQKVFVIGHSRLGKAALWAGALDQRFDMVISNNSGCGGAALSRRQFGETVERINNNFPHWFAGNFKQYNKKEDQLPVDQHQLLALAAPRPLYVASASEDLWADPYGEFLAAKAASQIYEFMDMKGLPADYLPKTDQPVHGSVGYHIRSGKHNITLYDWKQYMDFADKHFEK